MGVCTQSRKRVGIPAFQVGETRVSWKRVLTQIKPYLDVINTIGHLVRCSWVCLLSFLPWIQCPFVLAATLDLFLTECIFEITLIEVIICSLGLLLHGNCSTAFSKLQLVEVERYSSSRCVYLILFPGQTSGEKLK